MSHSDIFLIVNTSVIPAWLVLILAPKRKWRNQAVYVFAVLMSSLYTFYAISGLSDFDPAAFNSLVGVKELFTKDEVVLAGWVHYLVFDLLIGNWMVNQSIRHRVRHYLVVPCLLLAFMFGPVGYLLFTIIKFINVRTLA